MSERETAQGIANCVEAQVIEHAEGFFCELPGGARVLFSSRAHGNLSTQRGPGAEHGRAARDRLCEGLQLQWLCASRQVHGVEVQQVRALAGRGGEAVAIDADGHATALAGAGMMVLTADCLPVALAALGRTDGDRDATVDRAAATGCAVAMVHAGWRGLAGGVLEQGVQALRELGGKGPIEAVIGPGAGVCCYEVGPEVHAAFGLLLGSGSAASGERAACEDGTGERVPGEKIDLRAIAREKLLAAGVDGVHDAAACTICDARFFSHRRQGEDAGRQAGIAWLA